MKNTVFTILPRGRPPRWPGPFCRPAAQWRARFYPQLLPRPLLSRRLALPMLAMVALAMPAAIPPARAGQLQAAAPAHKDAAQRSVTATARPMAPPAAPAATATTQTLAVAAGPAQSPETALSISADGLRQDLRFVREAMARTHPDLRHSADTQALERAMGQLEREAEGARTQDDAWRSLATLNPLLADAHAFIGFADWRGAAAAHLAAGGRFFPFEVRLDDAGRVYIRAELGGGKSRLAGARIVSIDGASAAGMAHAMLATAHGDTALFRRHLLAQRWWFYQWKTAGAPASYRLVLEHGGKRIAAVVPAAGVAPQILAADADPAGRFRFSLLPHATAVLTVPSFSGENKAAFMAFTRNAFAHMRQAGSRTLVIDVSANGGGDDDMWLEGLMPYLATTPYRTGSAYRKKVLATSADKGEIAGQVVHGEIATWRQPQPDNPLRFGGKTYVLIGPATYSSAILFANTMRDFGFATLAGSGGAARGAQSGGIRKFMLPQSGLALWLPRFVLDPPAGIRGDGLLRPDIALPPRPDIDDGQLQALLDGLK